jgi:hypothetical protein
LQYVWLCLQPFWQISTACLQFLLTKIPVKKNKQMKLTKIATVMGTQPQSKTSVA